MRILIDINHPGHVHLFKNLYWKLKENGHKVTIVASEKDINFTLLKKYGLLCKPGNSRELAGIIFKGLNKTWDIDEIEQYGKRFSWENVLKGVKSIYDELLSE